MSGFTRERRIASIGFLFLGSVLFAGCGAGSGTSGLPTTDALPSQAIPASSATQASAAHGKRSKKGTGAATYDSTILGDNPLSYYRMNDQTAVLQDVAPNPQNGSYGTAVTLGAAGLTSMYYPAAQFPGGAFATPILAEVASNAKLQPTVVSVEAWVTPAKLNTTNQYEPMVAYGRFSTGTPYQITITPINQFYFSVHTSTGSPSIVAKTTSSPGHVYHIVGTFDGSSLKLYVNGVLEGQGSASGTINYTGIYSWSGLAIGDGFDALAAHPIQGYAGTIGDVSIYNYALTPAQVANHYLTGVMTPPLTETPASSDAFVDSIGVNASFNYQGTVYDTQFSTLEPLLVASGIRHIRAGVAQNWPTYYTRLNQLAAAGIHSQLVTLGTETAAQLEAYPALVAPSMEAFEGPNEPDLSSDTNWVADTTAFMQLLYSTVKGNAATANLAVIGPSVVTAAGEAAIGNISANMDYGNIHPYYGTNNPGNTGTGSVTAFGRSGSLAYYMGTAGQVSGTKPIIASETGFGTNSTIAGNVSELCDGKEAPRTFLVHFQAGVKRTLPYQLVESGTAYGALGFFSYMGLLRQDLTPKPSYTAITALTTLLSDQGAPLTTTPLTYTISGNVNNLDHLLMQKRNGTYYLALWLEVSSWNATTSTDITAPAQSVTVAMPNTVASGSLYTLDDFGNMTSTTLTPANGTVTVPVADRVTIFAFHP